MATPKKGTSAYLRICHPEHGVAPTSERVLQDASRVLDAIVEIVKARGTVIADMNNRTGKRREHSVSSSAKWGGV